MGSSSHSGHGLCVRCRLWAMLAVISMSCIWGCAGAGKPRATTADPTLRILVGPITLEAPISRTTQIYSFDEKPSAEREPVLLAELKDEIEIKAQRFLTEDLARHEGLAIIPFEEARRMLADLGLLRGPLTETEIRDIGVRSGADIVLTGLIHDYGAVRWQYWVTGLAIHSTTELLVIGFASGWNPVIVVPAYFLDLITDVPLWYGGAYIFGVALRPVRIHIDASQLTNCEGVIWSEEELVIKVPGKILAEYPPEERSKKQFQLEANLKRAAKEIATPAAEKLRIQPCDAEGHPKRVKDFSFLSFLDFLF